MANAIGDRIDASPVIPALVKAGWKDAKQGRDFIDTRVLVTMQKRNVLMRNW